MILINSAIELPAIQKWSYLVTKNTSRVILLNKDALQMKKDSKFTQYVEWAIMLVLVIGAVRLFQMVDFTDDLRPASALGKFIMVLGIIAMAFIVLAAHELGHLLAGLAQGFRFELFVVGPLGIKREEDKVKVYWNTNLSYYGGVAGTSPLDDHPDNARRFARVLLAGPLASLLFAAICFLLASLIQHPVAVLLFAGGSISVAIFFATTVPSRTGMFFTDRKRYQRLVQPGKDQEVELAMLRILGKFAKDNSFKNVSRADIDVMVADDYPSIRFFGLFNLICYQIEHQGAYAPSVMEAYQAASEEMPKAVVKAFDQEIEKYQLQVAA